MLETILVQGFCPHKIEITHFANGFCLVTSLSRKVMQTLIPRTRQWKCIMFMLPLTYHPMISPRAQSRVCVLRKQCLSPCFVFFFFVGNVNKQEYLKTYSLLKFSEIWQKSCSY